MLNADERSALLRLFDTIEPWYRPCVILKTTLFRGDAPSIESIRDSLTNWPKRDATAIASKILAKISQPEDLSLSLNSENVELIDSEFENVDPRKTILTFAPPLIAKERQLALILYHVSGPRNLRLPWALAALGRICSSDRWQVLVQYRPGVILEP